MNRIETKQILAVLRSAYPNFYRGLPDSDLSGIVDLWAEMFKDDPVVVVAVAVKAMIASRTSTFPPNIGEIKAQIVKMQTPDEMTEQEAWSLVAKALRNSCYGAKEEFAALPPMLQRLVGSPNQLREWAMMDAETVQSVVASNFQRSYKVRAASERSMLTLPADVKAAISSIAEKMKMEALPEGDVQ